MSEDQSMIKKIAVNAAIAVGAIVVIRYTGRYIYRQALKYDQKRYAREKFENLIEHKIGGMGRERLLDWIEHMRSYAYPVDGVPSWAKETEDAEFEKFE